MHRGKAAAPERAASPGRPHRLFDRTRDHRAGPGSVRWVLRLQATAGNRATTALLGRSLTVQRHSSWEHTLLGDTPPARLGQAAVTRAGRGHLLSQEWARMMFFSQNPGGDPRGRFPDVRWIQLKASKLWVSNGELNALADYLRGAEAYDTLPRDTILPVIQRMRSGIRAVTGGEFGLRGSHMEGQAEHWLPGAGGELKALDKATESLGPNRYAGLVARNACHFAPMSWERWALNHNEAREEARAHFAVRTEVAPIKDIDVSAEEHQRQAILKNGYADHFLQDSFAAGHLVNKTLVMQWFVDYLNTLSWWARPWFGLPDDEVMATMGSAQQPGIAGLDRYARTPSDTATAGADRASGRGATDPQTAQERADREGRVAGSGVSGTGAERERNYQAYLRFMNSGFLQKAAGAAHDHFNERGLTVANAAGTEMRVGGDDTMLSQSNQVGAETAGEAARLSRQAIDDIVNTGTTAISVAQIFGLVPQFVVVSSAGGKTTRMPLADWQQNVLHDLCIRELFPDVVATFSENTVVRTFGAEMVSGGISIDSGRPPPPEIGDFPTPSGPSRPA